MGDLWETYGGTNFRVLARIFVAGMLPFFNVLALLFCSWNASVFVFWHRIYVALFRFAISFDGQITSQPGQLKKIKEKEEK